jgi:hypothetical protein
VVEDASMRHKKYCADILLREWGTCGKVRPSLGHLKYLLEKAELFRAADFVAVDVLKQEPPSRPEKGPAAPVLFNSEELKDTEIVRIEKLLDAMDYPSSAIEKITRNNSICTNINYSTKEASKVIPKIIVHESPDVEEPGPPSFSVPIVVQNERVKSEPDMIQFSTSTVAASDTNLPNLSSLLSNETSVVTSEEVTSSNNIPAVVENMSSEQNVDVNRPNLSSLLKESNDSESNFNVPVLSELSTTSSSESSSNYPALSQLIDSSDSKSTSSKSSLPAFGQLVDDSAKISRSCGSPLPNLSLNTPLPHFTYGELEHATDNFDETPLDQKGRFLGAGAFGKVYLAVGLFGKPVAVKKMLLENEEVVRVNDTVTKQFINEVENLSKYKHENLVSLLGYSCDGATYCILYEYVPGGSLKDKLQVRTERVAEYVLIFFFSETRTHLDGKTLRRYRDGQGHFLPPHGLRNASDSQRHKNCKYITRLHKKTKGIFLNRSYSSNYQVFLLVVRFRVDQTSAHSKYQHRHHDRGDIGLHGSRSFQVGTPDVATSTDDGPFQGRHFGKIGHFQLRSGPFGTADVTTALRRTSRRRRFGWYCFENKPMRDLFSVVFSSR